MTKTQFAHVGAVVVLSMTIFSCNVKGDRAPNPVLASSTSEWTEHEGGPVIRYSKAGSGILLNDPSVIKEGSGYRMWATGGEPFATPLIVRAYEAFSEDGITWNSSFTPILEPGEKGDWDDARIETVSVIKVGEIYHLYYAGCSSPCNTGQFSIGHAISEDGTRWVKDAANPVIEAHENALEWGFYTTAEPAIVHLEGTFYLYYASAKSNYPDKGAPFGILLATSEDGSRFEKHGPVYTMTDSYDPKLFRGYSTPMVFIADGLFHLYHDVVHTPDKPSDYRQVAISYATSEDGFSFSEADTNIIAVEPGYKQTEINGPTVLKDGGTTKMWFGARTDEPDFAFGIGYAFKEDD